VLLLERLAEEAGCGYYCCPWKVVAFVVEDADLIGCRAPPETLSAVA